MKLTALYSVLLLTGLFVVGPQLSVEARHPHSHFSLGIGTAFSSFPRSAPVERYHSAYPVESYRPAYVEEHYYYPYGESVTVYHAPRPVVRDVYVTPPRPARPAFFSGFSLGFNIR